MYKSIESLEGRTLFAGGILDTSFGVQGTAAVSNIFGLSTSNVRFNAVASDVGSSRIYAVGGAGRTGLLARFTANGGLDTTMAGGAGYVTIDLAAINGAEALAVLPDGDVLVGATHSYDNAGPVPIEIARFNPNGTLDGQWGVNGVLTTTFDGTNSTLNWLGVDASGRIYAGGSTVGTNGVGSFAVARLNNSGSLDADFGTNGIATITKPNARTLVEDVSFMPDGGVALLGRGYEPYGDSRSSIAMFNSDGSPDASFDQDGLLTLTNFGGSGFAATDMAVQADGRIVVGGTAGSAVLVRVRADGSFEQPYGTYDATFGTNGFTYLNTNGGSYGGINALEARDGQGLVVVGPLFTASTINTYVRSYDFNGRPLNEEAAGLRTVYDLTGPNAAAFVQPSGQVLLVGGKTRTNGTGYTDPAISRLTAPQSFTTIAGKIFLDDNGDGLRNNAETTYGGGQVYAYIDANRNKAYDSGEKLALADQGGNYRFTDLPSGTYDIATLGTSSLVPTTPVATVQATIGNTYAGPDLGVLRVYQINGRVFNDANGNGTFDTAETGLANRIVYADADNDNVFDIGERWASTLNTKGAYTLTLPAGTWTIRQKLPDGEIQTGRSAINAPAGNTFVTDSTVVIPRDATASAYYDFGSKVPAATRVGGFVVHDTNGNGVRDTGEEGLVPGDVVYVDSNNNGALDTGEPSFTTNVDGYWFNLMPGTYVLRQQLPAGWVQTGPANNAGYTVTVTGQQSIFVPYFFRYQPPAPATATITGRIFYDANRDGLYNEGDYGLDGDVFIDANNDGLLTDADPLHTSTARANGVYSLQVPPGAAVRLMFANGSGYSATTPTVIILTPTAGATYANQNFGVGPVPAANTLALSGVVYSDTNKNYKRDAGEPGMNLVRVYVDTNNNSAVDDNEYATYTNVNGAFAFPAIPATGKNATVRVVLPAGYTLKYPSSNGGYVVPLTAKSNVTTLNFGLVPGATPPPTLTPVSVTGLVYGDANKSNTKDGAETGIANVTVFADLDNDGVLDANEAKAVTTSTGAYTLSVPAVGGVLVNATLRVVLPGGYTQQSPTTNYTISLAPGGKYTAKDFGLYKAPTPPPANTASISGLAFNDTNKNGLYDTGDSVAGGKTVWLDLDDDGVKDANEASVVTDSAGKFSFKNLAAGRYHVRRVFPTGYLESTPARYVTLTNGQTATDVRIGSKVK